MIFSLDLPGEVIFEIARQLWIDQDFDSLYNLAIAHKDFIPPVRRWLFHTLIVSTDDVSLIERILHFDQKYKNYLFVRVVQVYSMRPTYLISYAHLLSNVTTAHFGLIDASAFASLWNSWSHLRDVYIGDLTLLLGISEKESLLSQRPVERLVLSECVKMNALGLRWLLSACPQLKSIYIDLSHHQSISNGQSKHLLVDEADLANNLCVLTCLRHVELVGLCGFTRMRPDLIIQGILESKVEHLKVVSNQGALIPIPRSLLHLEIICHDWNTSSESLVELLHRVPPSAKVIHIILQETDHQGWTSEDWDIEKQVHGDSNTLTNTPMCNLTNGPISNLNEMNDLIVVEDLTNMSMDVDGRWNGCTSIWNRQDTLKVLKTAQLLRLPVKLDVVKMNAGNSTQMVENIGGHICIQTGEIQLYT